MRTDHLFSSFIERSLERVPLLELREDTELEGVSGQLSHVILQNILTEFDACLSRNLAAIRGHGLPAVTVTSRFSTEGSGKWVARPARHFPSLPHALRQIAQDALEDRATSVLQVCATPNDPDQMQSRTIGPEDVHVLDEALKAAKVFGLPEFVPLSGDFDLVVLDPPGHREGRVTLDLFKGSVSLPMGADIVEAPLYGFRNYIEERPLLRVMLAGLRHQQMDDKNRAVQAFRAMAEDRILRFDRALAGNALEYHRLDAAMSLIARLKAGLGDDLLGLSEDAQITALDWSAAIDRAEARRSDRQAKRVISREQRVRVMN
ncbi:MAG: hypothetical protein AAF415_03650 [Pseudomonadota bacterium]